MGKVRVHNFSMSLDGFGAGADQTFENPLGVGGEQLHEWALATRTYTLMLGTGEGSTGLDDEIAAARRRGHRRHDHGPQHVRTDPRRLG